MNALTATWDEVVVLDADETQRLFFQFGSAEYTAGIIDDLIGDRR